jgi:3-hydroxy-9,10-secoandrosta-1,3,5(10)-triene-9,17-dione monooxygenase reductase component
VSSPADASASGANERMPQATVDGLAFREAIAHFATGVTVVSTTYHGRPAGMTASAVCSLSLDPVLLLVCVDNRLATHKAIEASRRFAVNVLGEGDEPLARHFARSADDKFDGVPLVEGSDPPILAQAIASFVCDVQERVPGGDHSIFVGRVLSCAATPGRRPLLYFRSSFGALRDPHAEFLDEAAGWDAASIGGFFGHAHMRPR